MKSNILFVGLDYEHVKIVSKEICAGFDMFFLDVNGLIEYNLSNVKNVEKVCGIEYLNQERQKIALSVNSYENTVINMPYSLFLEKDIANKLQENAITVYLRLSKKTLNAINKQKDNLLPECIAFEEFDKLLSKKSQIIVKCKNKDIKTSINLTLDALKQQLL